MLGAPSLKHRVPNDQHRVSAGHYRALHSALCGYSLELGRLITILLAGGGPNGLTQGLAQPFGAVARRARNAFAGALVIAGTDRGPGRQMMSGRKLGYICADFGDQATSCHVVTTLNTLPELDGLCQRRDAVGQSPFQRFGFAHLSSSTHPKVS